MSLIEAGLCYHRGRNEKTYGTLGTFVLLHGYRLLRFFLVKYNGVVRRFIVTTYGNINIMNFVSVI